MSSVNVWIAPWGLHPAPTLTMHSLVHCGCRGHGSRHELWSDGVFHAHDQGSVVPVFVRSQPLYLNMTWAKNENHLTLRNARFRDQVAALAAPMHGITKDELEGDDIREQRKLTGCTALTCPSRRTRSHRLPHAPDSGPLHDPWSLRGTPSCLLRWAVTPTSSTWWRLVRMGAPWPAAASAGPCGCGEGTSTKQSSGSVLPPRTPSPPRSGRNTSQRICATAHPARDLPAPIVTQLVTLAPL
jgi:hypothetical protein